MSTVLDNSTLSLSSLKISELPCLSSVDNNALFVFERGSNSYKMSYKDLYACLSAQFNKIVKIRSMAYKQTYEYAKFGHGHEYSDFDYFPSYGPQSNNDKYKNRLSCEYYGKFKKVSYGPGHNVSSLSEISVYAPSAVNVEIDQTKNYKKIVHSIGDLQPLAMNGCSFGHYLSAYRNYSIKSYGSGKSNVDIYNSNFDGWVVPNGTTFACGSNEFRDACAMYSASKSPTATSFTVPNIDTFLSCNPGVQTTNAIEKRDGQVGIAAHKHSLKLDYGDGTKLTLNAGSFKLYTSATNAQMLSFVHGGSGNFEKVSSEISVYKFDADATLLDASVKEFGSGSEAYPAYNALPMMIYIGEK